jgi:hypothetical protein
MSDVDAIAEHIREIGEKMVADYQPAPDVVLDKKQGIIPRCLIFEKESRNPQRQGSVVVGVNSGNSLWEEERQFYRECGCSYEAVVKFWPRVREYSRYYKLLTGFVDAAGFIGPILWTELVKCESKQDTVLSIETIRKDIYRYLFRELEKIPSDWPLIGVGPLVSTVRTDKKKACAEKTSNSWMSSATSARSSEFRRTIPCVRCAA